VTVSDPSANPLTMSVPAAARLLGISRGGAYELARRGQLPGAIKLGGRTVVSRQVLERTINGDPKETS
jgi:predicted DNA-binding transcriptional regulator AlpA